MIQLVFPLFILFIGLLTLCILWRINSRKYISSGTVASAYDAWTKDKLLERLWGEHIHLGFYATGKQNIDFREAKVQFVHKLVNWSGLDKLPKGSRILDVGCGIGGSSRILAKYYGFNVTAITISPAQVKRARELTPSGLNCNFLVMDALNLKFEDGSFDAVWSVEAGAHMNDKNKFADEMLRILRPGGYLAIADWNSNWSDVVRFDWKPNQSGQWRQWNRSRSTFGKQCNLRQRYRLYCCSWKRWKAKNCITG